MRLAELLRLELSNIPVEHWEYFFPAWVALWRFVEEARPGVLGELRAGYDREGPYFRGRGATWFMDILANDEGVLQGVERVMYGVADAMRDVLPGAVSIRVGDLPELPREVLEIVAARALAPTDQAIRDGLL